VLIVDENVDTWKRCSERVVDSGANFNVIPKSVAEDLYLQIFEEEHPYEMQFGQGATILLTQFIKGNELLENLAISEGFSAILFNIIQFTSQGIMVIFDKTKVVVEYDGKTIIEGRILTQSNLCVFDLKELLGASKVHTSSRSQDDQTERKDDMDSICYSSISQRHKKEDIKQARQLHRHLDHMVYGQIVSNIRHGIWKNVSPNITASLVEAVGAKVWYVYGLLRQTYY
jgi:predicted aspartyl protease